MQEATKRVLRESRIETVDSKTGEVVLDEQVTESVLPKEPNFVKLYLRDLMQMENLSPSLNTVMFELVQVMDYENLIYLNSALKRKIEKRCGLSVSSINNSITAFVKSGFLERQDVGLYRVNPYLFGKGEWKNIYRIRMEVTYTMEGKKTIKSVMENKDGQEIQSDSESR